MFAPILLLAFFQAPPPAPAQPPRTELNLLGQTDAASGENRRNENQQFNLIDTNTVKDLNLRLGTTATLIPEFRADSGYFGSQYGGPAQGGPHPPPAAPRTPVRAELRFAHLNSVFSARSFFQVGGVRPARENDYGIRASVPLRKAFFRLDARQQKVRGQVNGNVLVPLPGERTPLTNDPVLRPIVERFLAGYPAAAPNRTDVDPRMLNTNAQQRINTNTVNARMDLPVHSKHRLTFSHAYTTQSVLAFQFVAGQNPDTDTHSHNSRASWSFEQGQNVWTATTALDRVTTHIRPSADSIGPTISVSNFIAGLSPAPPIPLQRAQTRYRQALAARRAAGKNEFHWGGEVSRNQINGREQDVERGLFQFSNDFGRDAVANFRMGTPSAYTIALGNTHRGFRNWFAHLFAGGRYRPVQTVQLDFGLRYEIATRPYEVDRIDTVPYGCDCNNVAPRMGFAYRLPGAWGRFRAAYATHFGEIFATTYGQVRMNAPRSIRFNIPRPDLANPLGGLTFETLPRNIRGGVFEVSPEMTTPYEHQYNASWEFEAAREWRVQLGYVGSRSVKLFQMWFDNRARVVPGIAQITQTVNERRADPARLEVFRLLNASRAYYDAGRVTVLVPRRRGVSADLSYWFSKAIDLGNDYTSTLAGVDARQGRSQGEANVHQDLKGRTAFDQPHALMARGAYEAKWMRGVQWTGVFLLKNGTPFNVESGSDGPGFGNVDGQGSDRVHILDPSILGRSVGDPDRSMAVLSKSRFAFQQPLEGRGNIGRNVFRRGKIANVNASVSKSFRLSKERLLELRGESINLFNTPQFSEPIKELSSPTFGRIVNTLNEGRTLRLQLRLQL